MLHAITPYGINGASSRVRVFEWLSRVEHPSVVTSYISHRNAKPRELVRRPVAVLGAERRLRRIARSKPSHLLLHREASPLSRGGLEGRLIASAAFSVYDLDDALHVDFGEGALFRRWAPKGPKALLAARRADRVIAASPALAEWAAQHNHDVVLIPSCVAPEDYEPKVDYCISDPPRLGWIGSPDNECYLQIIEPALRVLHERHGARLTLIGTTEQGLGDIEEYIDRVPWSQDAQKATLASLDVGLMPLPDEPYTRGKAGYKLLQYAAAGVPAVGTPIGVNRTILDQLGMPAPSTSDEWVDAIDGLIACSNSEREARGAHCRQVATELYSFDAWKPRWMKAVGIPPLPGEA